MNKKFFILIILALIFRLILAALPGFKIDIDSFFAWAFRLADFGPWGFYSKDVFTDYTPGYLYILTILGIIGKNLNQTQFYFLLKLPAILADLGLGIVIYRVCRQYKLTYNKSLLLSILALFNPGLIFNSTIWGQVDSVLTLAMVLSIYYLTHKKYLIASIWLGLSFLIKPQTISIFPIFLLFLIKNPKLKIAVQTILPFGLTLFVLSLPFFLIDPIFGLIKKVLETSKEYPYTSLFAFNFWGMIGMWTNDLDKWYYSINYQLWGYFLFISFWLITGYIFFKKNLSLYSLSALATLGFFFLPTRVHERYLYPALIFLVFSAIETKSYFLIIFQCLLSIIYLLDLYYVYLYYNFFYSHTAVAFFNQNLYNLLDQNLKLISVFSTVLFVVITIYILNRDVSSSTQKS